MDLSPTILMIYLLVPTYYPLLELATFPASNHDHILQIHSLVSELGTVKLLGATVFGGLELYHCFAIATSVNNSIYRHSQGLLL